MTRAGNGKTVQLKGMGKSLVKSMFTKLVGQAQENLAPSAQVAPFSVAATAKGQMLLKPLIAMSLSTSSYLLVQILIQQEKKQKLILDLHKVRGGGGKSSGNYGGGACQEYMLAAGLAWKIVGEGSGLWKRATVAAM